MKLESSSKLTGDTTRPGRFATRQTESWIKLYEASKSQGRTPANSVIIAALKECGKSMNLRQGRRIHEHIGETIPDLYVANTLLAMYAKCKSLADARSLFDKMPRRSVVSWNSMIMGYADAGRGDLALELYSRMQKQEKHCKPDKVTFLAALKACASAGQRNPNDQDKYLEAGREIHSQVISAGLDSDNFVTSTLLVMYTRCGSVSEARKVFNDIPIRDVVSWNAMITGYAANGDGRKALELFSEMQELSSRCLPDAVTYLAALKACYAGHERKQEFLECGRRIHEQLLDSGLGQELSLLNTLVMMYARCGSSDEARKVFEKIQNPTVVSWNAIIQGYADAGDGEAALKLFRRMEEKPDKVTYLAALKACWIEAEKLDPKHPDGEARRLELLSCGRKIHEEARVRGLHGEEFLANGLVTMYCKCGSMGDAQRVFDEMGSPSLVSWNALILGFAESEDFEPALSLLDRMQSSGSFVPDKMTILAALKAFTRLASQEQGRELEGKLVKFSSLGRTRRIHTFASSLKLIPGDRRVMNSLISAYSKCGCMLEARRLFDRIESPDLVSWTVLVTGYGEAGEPEVAMEFFRRMREEAGLKPDRVAYLAALWACGNLSDLKTGRELHNEIKSSGIDVELDPALGNSLVDLYGKCGSMREAEEVFISLVAEKRSLVSWNSLIAGYNRQGDSVRVLELFDKMMTLRERLRPDEVTFLSVLSACSHAGMVERGLQVLEFMRVSAELKPGIEHYCCVVDLLGRSNQLELAEGMIRGMECEANVRIWMTLLDACAKWGNAGVGKMAFDEVMRIDTRVPAAYVLISNIYNRSL